MDEITVGLSAEQSTTVTKTLTARAMGSGDLTVYATPAMVALMEAAAVAAIAPVLPEGMTSVGIRLEVDHLAATSVGETVHASAEVTGVDGQRVIFEVRAWDDHDTIGEGVHVRYVIDRNRFMQRLNTKSG